MPELQPKITDIINKKVIILSAAFVFTLIIGYILGLSSVSVGQIPGGNQSIQDQLTKLQNQLEKAKKLFPQINDMRSISGKIQGINGNVIKVEAAVSPNPFDDLPAIREVVATKDTKIIKQEPKDPKVFQREQEAYQKELESVMSKATPENPAMNLPTPPLPFEEKELALKDLKQGDSIFAEANENIKTKTRFEATRIIVQEVPSTPTGPAAGPAVTPQP